MNPANVIILATVFLAYDAYNDNKYITLLKSWKKYYVVIGYLLIGYMLVRFIRKHPEDGYGLVKYATNTIKYLPSDKSATDVFAPVFKHADEYFKAQQEPVMMSAPLSGPVTEPRSKPNHKRSVSEAKKKYVAAQQGWCCASCKKQLPAWFEIDHTVRLDRGGSNDVSNLTALCRDCHGRKTAEEHLNIL